MDSIGLQRSEKALDQCVVKVVPTSVHASENMVIRQNGLMVFWGVLTSSVTVVDQARVGIALTGRPARHCGGLRTG